jgi:inner membrane protein YidH
LACTKVTQTCRFDSPLRVRSAEQRALPGEHTVVAEAKTTIALPAERPDLLTTTGLAVERTVMAAERTLMAWIRTGLSMLSFGFTIYKFLLYVRESLSASVLQAQGPRRFGISLIGLGTLSMIFGLIEYRRLVKGINAAHNRRSRPFVFFIGAISVLLGLFLLITILLHREVF